MNKARRYLAEGSGIFKSSPNFSVKLRVKSSMCIRDCSQSTRGWAYTHVINYNYLVDINCFIIILIDLHAYLHHSALALQ